MSSKDNLVKTYQKKTDKEHVLDNPDTYTGSMNFTDYETYVYNEKDSAKKMLLEYGPIYSKYEFFCFNEKNDLNKSIVSKLKKYKLD